MCVFFGRFLSGVNHSNTAQHAVCPMTVSRARMFTHSRASTTTVAADSRVRFGSVRFGSVRFGVGVGVVVGASSPSSSVAEASGIETVWVLVARG